MIDPVFAGDGCCGHRCSGGYTYFSTLGDNQNEVSSAVSVCVGVVRVFDELDARWGIKEVACTSRSWDSVEGFSSPGFHFVTLEFGKFFPTRLMCDDLIYMGKRDTMNRGHVFHACSMYLITISIRQVQVNLCVFVDDILRLRRDDPHVME